MNLNGFVINQEVNGIWGGGGKGGHWSVVVLVSGGLKLFCTLWGILNRPRGSTKNPAINKWRGDNYLALKSNRITGIQLVRENK